MSASRSSRTNSSWMARRGGHCRGEFGIPRGGNRPLAEDWSFSGTGASLASPSRSRQRTSATAHSWQPCRVCQTGARRAAPRCRTHGANRLAAAEVADQLEVLAAETGADERLVTTITHRHADRMRSYELLAAGERAGGRGGRQGVPTIRLRLRMSGPLRRQSSRRAIRRQPRSASVQAASASGVDQVDVVVRQTAIGSDERCATQLGLGDEQAVERIMMVER